jgi:ABC-type transport system involved in multi-copper enzyme maturation permease subunit
MMRLLRVELTRLRWRRAVLLLLAAAVVVPTVIWGATAWNTRPVSAAEQAQTQQLVEEEAGQPYIQRELKRCLAKPRQYGAVGDDVQAACEEVVLPRVEWYATRMPLALAQEREGSALAVVTVLSVLLLLLGTTFAGHDWTSGSMSNQLLFDPRRARVWAAKGLTVLLVGALLAAVVLAAYWTGLWVLAEHRGLDPSSAVVSEGYQQVLRGTLFAAGAAVGGYALTMLFRSTVATLGVLFAFSLLVPLMLSLIAFGGYEKWMPQNNIAAFVLDGATYYVQNTGMEHRLSMTHGTVYLLGVLLVAAIPSVASFRTRDVP